MLRPIFSVQSHHKIILVCFMVCLRFWLGVNQFKLSFCFAGNFLNFFLNNKSFMIKFEKNIFKFLILGV